MHPSVYSVTNQEDTQESGMIHSRTVHVPVLVLLKHLPPRIQSMVIIINSPRFSFSSFLSVTTSTGQGTRSWAWPDWLRMSWQRSLTSCYLSWKVGGLNPDHLCQPPLNPPQCLPIPQPPMLHRRNAKCLPEMRAVGRALGQLDISAAGDGVFLNLCVYVCCMVYGLAVSTVIWKGQLPEQNALIRKSWLGFPNEIWTGNVEFATIHKIKCSSELFLQSLVLIFQISYRCSGLVYSMTSWAETQCTPL